MSTARVYVGTYAKYNAGSIAGKWLDLEEFGDKEDFLEACKNLHADESDPELMFHDYEGFPESFYSESYISDELWEWLEMSEDDRDLLAIYREHVDSTGTLEQAQEALIGSGFNSESDWAEDYWDSTGMLESIPESLRNYIDYAAYARDARLGGDVTFVRHNGDVWVFSNH